MHSLCLNCISVDLNLILSKAFKKNFGKVVFSHSCQFVVLSCFHSLAMTMYSGELACWHFEELAVSIFKEEWPGMLGIGPLFSHFVLKRKKSSCLKCQSNHGRMETRVSLDSLPLFMWKEGDVCLTDTFKLKNHVTLYLYGTESKKGWHYLKVNTKKNMINWSCEMFP